MRIVPLVFIVLLFVCANGKSENENEADKKKSSLEIFVIDDLMKEPLPAAKAKIEQKDLEAYTDFDGLAKITEVTEGSYNIEISYISYQKQHFKAVQFSKLNTKVVVKLNP